MSYDGDDNSGKLDRLFEILRQKDRRFCTKADNTVLRKLLSGDDGYYYRIIGYFFEDNSKVAEAFVNASSVESAEIVIKVWDINEEVLNDINERGRYVNMRGSSYSRFIIKSIEKYKRLSCDLTDLINKEVANEQG